MRSLITEGHDQLTLFLAETVADYEEAEKAFGHLPSVRIIGNSRLTAAHLFSELALAVA